MDETLLTTLPDQITECNYYNSKHWPTVINLVMLGCVGSWDACKI